MVRRVVASAVILLGIACAGFGAKALVDSHDMASFIGQVAPPQGVTFDPEDWMTHWRVSSAAMLIAGAAFATAGIGLYHRRVWAGPLLGAVFLFMLAADVLGTVTGYSRYAFEIGHPAGRLFLLVAVLLCAFITWRRLARRASDYQ